MALSALVMVATFAVQLMYDPTVAPKSRPKLTMAWKLGDEVPATVADFHVSASYLSYPTQ